MPFDNMIIVGLLLELDTIYFMNSALNNHLVAWKSINTLNLKYIRFLRHTNGAPPAGFAVAFLNAIQ
jgi:hypothetical protein